MKRKIEIPPTSILFDSYPIAVYRILRHYVPPPARVLDLCCGTALWPKWIQEEYDVVLCDTAKKSKANILSDLRYPPFRKRSFDAIMADLPFPYYTGNRYSHLDSLHEYESLLQNVAEAARRLLKAKGKLILKACDFWASELTPGPYIVHKVIQRFTSFKAIDVIIFFRRPMIYSPGRFKRALRMHNYVLVYERR